MADGDEQGEPAGAPLRRGRPGKKLSPGSSKRLARIRPKLPAEGLAVNGSQNEGEASKNGQSSERPRATSGSTRKVIADGEASPPQNPPKGPRKVSEKLRKRFSTNDGDTQVAGSPPPAPSALPKAEPVVGEQSTVVSELGGESLWKARQAIELFERGQVGKAMSLVQQGLASTASPDARALLLSLSGYRSLVKGEPGKALEALEEAVATLPRCGELEPLEQADVYFRLADICEQLRNIVAGIDAVRKCIDILVELEDTGRLRKALAAKGRLHYLMRQYQKSFESFEMALSCEGEEPEAWKLFHGIAKCYDKQGDKDRAKKAYEASRRSVMSKARDRFGELVSDSGQAPRLLIGAEDAEPDEATPAAEAAEATESEPADAPKRPSSSHRAPIEARVPAVSEAYPRDELLRRLRSEDAPAATAPTVEAASEEEVELAEELPEVVPPRPTAGQETIALPAQELIQPARSTLRRSWLAWTLGGVPGVLGIFLFGLWFGQSGLEREVEKARAEALALQAESRRWSRSRASLELSLAASELRGQRPGQAAAWAARAAETFATLGEGPGPGAAEALRLARESLEQGPWGWRVTAAHEAEEVRSLSLSPWGDVVVSWGSGGRVKFWGAYDGAPRALVPEREALFARGAWFASGEDGVGQRLVGLSERGGWSCVELLPGSEPQLLAREVGEGFVAVTVAPSGERLVTRSAAGQLQVWSAQTGQSLGPAFQPQHRLTQVAFLIDERRLIAARDDGGLDLLDLSGGLIEELPGAHRGAVRGLAIAGADVLSVGANGSLKLWRYSEGTLNAVASLAEGSAGPARRPLSSWALWVGRGVRQVALGDDEGQVWRGRFAEGSWSFEEPVGGGGQATRALAFLPNGGAVIAGSGAELRSWRWGDAATIEQRLGRTLDGALISGAKVPVVAARAKDGRVTLLSEVAGTWIELSGPVSEATRSATIGWPSLSASGRRLARLANPTRLESWSLDGARSPDVIEAEAPLSALTLLDNGRRLLAGTERGGLVLFDREGAAIATLPVGEAPIARIVASPNGDAALVVSRDGSVQVWRAGASKPLEHLTGAASKVPEVAFARDGRRLAVWSGEAGLQIWELGDDGRISAQGRWRLKGSPQPLAFSADSQRIAVAEDGGVALRDIATGDALERFAFGGRVCGLGFLAGPRLLMASEDGRLRIQPIVGPGFSESQFRTQPTRNISARTGLPPPARED